MTFFNTVMHNPLTLVAIDRGQTYIALNGIVFNEILYDTELLDEYAKDEYDAWLATNKENPDRKDMLRRAEMHVMTSLNDTWLRERYRDVAMSYILLGSLPVSNIRTAINTYADIGLQIRDLVQKYQQNYQADLTK